MTRKQNETFGASKLIPYSAHITDEIVKLKGGSYLMCFRLKGTNYIGRGQEEIDARVLQISQLIGQMRAPYRYNLQIQSHCAPILHLSVLQRPVFLLNSRLGLFTAAYSRRHPFSRSYGVILPSSLTMVLSLTLEFSSQLPVSVCGTGTSYLDSGFS